MVSIKFERRNDYGQVRWYPHSPEDAVAALGSLTGRQSYDEAHFSSLERLGVKIEKVVIIDKQELSLP